MRACCRRPKEKRWSCPARPAPVPGGLRWRWRRSSANHADRAAYLDDAKGRFSEESCAAFLEGFQARTMLEMGEIWALKPALQLELLLRLDRAPADQWPQLVVSLRHVGETAWKELFESASMVHRALGGDPLGSVLPDGFR